MNRMKRIILLALIGVSFFAKSQLDPTSQFIFDNMFVITAHDSVVWSEDTGSAFMVEEYQMVQRFMNGHIDTSSYYYNGSLEYSSKGIRNANATTIYEFDEFSGSHDSSYRYIFYADANGKDTLMAEADYVNGAWEDQSFTSATYNAQGKIELMEAKFEFGGTFILVGSYNFHYGTNGLLDSLILNSLGSIQGKVYPYYDSNQVMKGLNIYGDTIGNGNYVLTFKNDFRLNALNEVTAIIEYDYEELPVYLYETRFEKTAGSGLSVRNFVAPSFEIFPNPANDKLIINADSRFTTYTIVDINSKVVQQGAVSRSIDLSGLSKGAYLISLNGGLTASVQKLIIE